ncbi:tetratricopeptide repeat protein [Sphingomicrobium sediminis]|uniref:Tetratricopeptide repeat protein n=1 Tax=Sphingomicrobium sediminis TaxID=2950949 RepID=A0A9X2EH75_9SPHN|nr:tetratricopeptide repeat protein [Sphingomicrobium sediminis]MCM8557955.1 tetratricopeptide repeat protein [Sphingomicrobium sediminis]
MNLSLAMAALIAVAQPAEDPQRWLAEADHALSQGRTQQARLMLTEAVRFGLAPAERDRLTADIELAEGNAGRALAMYRTLMAGGLDDPMVKARAGRAAVMLGQNDEAARLLDEALMDGEVAADWRVWNLRGVAADRRGRFAIANAAYTRALAIEPSDARLLNNAGFSRMLQGDWAEALAFLRAANRLDPNHARIAANLQLVEMALAGNLPVRGDGETREAYAARLNDAGVVAALRGERQRALAAFTRAIEARSDYYERAAANLQRIQGQ